VVVGATAVGFPIGVVVRQIFLDTETTGLSADAGDRIVEIGCVEMLNRRLSGNNRHFYLNPERANSEGAFAVHGLSDEFLSDKPLFSAVADELIQYLAGAEVVIHNASFDVGFLNHELRRIKRPTFEEIVAEVTDSLTMARELFPGKANSLDALCRRLEVDNSKRELHGALMDAELLAEVYIRMTRGQESLVIEATESTTTEFSVESVDLSGVDLLVIEADDMEVAAHAALLADVEKASGGKAAWKVGA